VNRYLGGGLNAYAAGPATTTLRPDAVATVGGSQPHENRQPYLTLSFCIALQGIFPSRN
jgi:microcystin-dependent protein